MVLAACGGGDSPPSESRGSIAAACASDAECEPGLICIQASANEPVFGGGPANGYCSKRCSAHGDCSDDLSVLCAGDEDGQNGICVLTCTVGPALRYLNDRLDPTKCHGRDDVRCASVSLDANVCLPTCGDDAQCPPGRVCDPRSAVCVDSASAGKPMGAPCDPAAMTLECAGVCVPFDDGEAICSSRCVLGGNNDPEAAPECGGPESGYCFYRAADSGAGDEAACAPACASQDDCHAPSLWCIAIPGLTGRRVENGYCLSTDACPGGDGDCRNDLDRCTPTRFGPFCLPSTFPLGSAAPDETPGG
ncbi:hypothetical protein BE17_47970 [Sorangium cellulosum]|uniref:Uncharacterized protein n=1 Tax=Sorangium cellulosum TaxID=56 RepID=A0A150QY55_SORCE|nr:hypothetical protein BE17_47970 [Sorangium cellulosum]